jgi:hypothetical protein
VQTAADVLAGETATAKVQMVRDLSPVPYHDVFPFEGFMQAWGTVAQWAVEIVVPTPLCQCSYTFTPSGNATGLVFEAFWDGTIPDPAGLGEFYWEIYDANVDWIESGYCTNPCRAEPSMEGFPQGAPITVRISGPDGWMEYQQQVHVYTTVFYNGEDATGFSIADPG